MKLFRLKRATPPPSKDISRIQAIAAGLGTVVILCCTAILVTQALTETPITNPIIAVSRTIPAVNGQVVEARVMNPSSRTLSAVSVSASVGDVTVSNTLDYLPAEGERTVSFVVPENGTLELSIDGWTEP